MTRIALVQMQVRKGCGRAEPQQIAHHLAQDAPGLYGEQAMRDWQSGYRWWEDKCRDQLGCTVDEDFPGAGYLFAPNGRRVYATPGWSLGVVYLDLDLASGQAAPL
jgi:hypothetical protein